MSTLTTSDWVKGITLSILATVFGAASKLSIRKSWLIEARLEDSNDEQGDDEFPTILEVPDARLPEDVERENKVIRRRALCFRYAGMFGMTFLNPLCGVLAMNYASPSITAPFSGMTLVWVVLFAKPLIGEAPTWSQIAGASLIVIGEVIVAIFGDHTNDEAATLQVLEESYREPAFLSYCVGVLLWMIFLAYCIQCSTSRLLVRFAWGVSGGSVTGMQNFLKDTLTIVKAGEGIPWYFFAFGAATIAVAFGGLLLLTACMKRYDAAFSSSMFVGSYVMSVSFMSAAHYHTFDHLQGIQNDILYPGGLIVLMLGVTVLVWETKDEGGVGQAPRAKRKQSYEMVPRRRLDS